MPISRSKSTSSKSITYKHLQPFLNKSNSVYFPVFTDMNSVSDNVMTSPEPENQTQTATTTVQTSTRPARERRPPTYLKDYECERH